jgi:hypothetical protein
MGAWDHLHVDWLLASGTVMGAWSALGIIVAYRLAGRER